MSFRNPLYMQNSSKFSYAAVDDRFIIDTLFSEGVMNVPAGQGLVVQRPAGAAMQVRVPILNAIIKGDDATNQGSYLIRMDVAEDVDIPAASTTNARIDLLVVEVVDSSYRTISTGGFEGVRLRVVAGTPAASPVAPALPATAIPLAQIAVAANAASIVTANITDQRTQSGAATLQIGTTAVPLTTTQRLALSNPITGYLVFDTTLGKLFTYGGTTFGWVAGILDVQTFTTSGTWTKPAGASIVFVDAIGAGGGGGAGSTGGSAATFTPSTGGGGGARARVQFQAGDLPATASVTVGAAGVAGFWDYVSSGIVYGGGNGGDSVFAGVRAGGGGGGLGPQGQGAVGVAAVQSYGGNGGGVNGAVAVPQYTQGGVFAVAGAGGQGSTRNGATSSGQLVPPVSEYGGGVGGSGGIYANGYTAAQIAGGASSFGGGGGGGNNGNGTGNGLNIAALNAGPGGASGNNPGGTAGVGSTTSFAAATPAGAGRAGTGGFVGSGGGGGGGGYGAANVWPSPGGVGGIPGGGGGAGGSVYGSTGGTQAQIAAAIIGGAGARGEVRVYTLCI